MQCIMLSNMQTIETDMNKPCNILYIYAREYVKICRFIAKKNEKHVKQLFLEINAMQK
jgi:hypothetical protein